MTETLAAWDRQPALWEPVSGIKERLKGSMGFTGFGFKKLDLIELKKILDGLLEMENTKKQFMQQVR